MYARRKWDKTHKHRLGNSFISMIFYILRNYYGYEEPYKDKTHWDSLTSDYLELDNDMFPEVKWSDKEPTRVKLVIDK